MKGWLWLPVTLDAGWGGWSPGLSAAGASFWPRLETNLVMLRKGGVASSASHGLGCRGAGVGGGVREGGRRAEPGARQGCPPGVGGAQDAPRAHSQEGTPSPGPHRAGVN